MNLLPRMIDELHCVAFLHAGIAQPGNEGDAETVAGGAGRGLQDFVVTRFHAAGDDRHRAPLFDLSQRLGQQRIERHGVALLFVGQFSLGVRDGDLFLVEIHIVWQRNGGFADSASCKNLSLAGNSHPSSIREGFSGSFKLFVGQFRLESSRLAADTQPGHDVALRVFQADRLVQDEGEEPEFHQGRVMGRAAGLSPIQVFASVFVSDFAGMPDALEIQPLREAFPSMQRSSLRGVSSVMALDVIANPFPECAFERTTDPVFILSFFIRDSLGRPGLFYIIAKQACGFFPPAARVEVFEANKPEAGIGVRPKMSHAGKVCHALAPSQCRDVTKSEFQLWRWESKCEKTNYRYTTGYRLSLTLSGLRIALTFLSHGLGIADCPFTHFFPSFSTSTKGAAVV